MISRCFATFLLLTGSVAVQPAAAQQELDVEVSIDGLGRSLTRELTPVSSLSREPEGYSSLAPIRRTANSDAQALVNALRSKGYYAAMVDPNITREENTVRVVFEIAPGEKFEITDYELRYVDEQRKDRPDTPSAAGIETSGAPTGAALKEIETGILRHFWNQGYLGAEIVNRQVRSDFGAGTGRAVFELKTGPEGRYGDIIVKGLERTDPDYVRQYRTFEEGDLAQREDLDEMRERLVETALFTEVEVVPQLPEEDGTTDILVRLAERDHRTLGGGVSYSTDIGPAVNLFWENRNILRRGETFRTELLASEPIQELAASFTKNRPRLPGFYNLAMVARNEDTDAFNAQTFEVGGSIAKLWLKRHLTTEGGIRYQYSDIDSIEEDTGLADETTFSAVSFPLRVWWNSQNRPLDPQGGFQTGVLVTPFVGTTNFTRVETSYIDRVFWGPEDGGTFAGRLKLGAIYGAGRGDIPATERFYAGGGGSLRGFAFQEASPIDPLTGDILGGASTAEFNFELRQHVTESIELAAFADVGGAFESNTPDFENVLVGVGGGVRYHTPIGPIRVDVAVPLDRREVFRPDPAADGDPEPDRVFQDAAFQVYIALGQPF